ncbi:hypothetical protein MLD38_017886 [Melastoma candidum]|uniref:Uncharacterized protein n=1 Tax=Melastoma candidum TaxID=119954 RepID=A0ACB9QSA5_9MYRT|nr:hypothetical protein MLD38_017886 [Melastoma candidum]
MEASPDAHYLIAIVNAIGYEFFAGRQLITIFSAPNYCEEFDNAGAMMSVDEALMCSFETLKLADKKPKSKSGGGNAAIPRMFSIGPEFWLHNNAEAWE